MFYPGASTSATRRPFHGGKTGILSVVRPRTSRNRRESSKKRVTPNQGDANVLPRRTWRRFSRSPRSSSTGPRRVAPSLTGSPAPRTHGQATGTGAGPETSLRRHLTGRRT